MPVGPRCPRHSEPDVDGAADERLHTRGAAVQRQKPGKAASDPSNDHKARAVGMLCRFEDLNGLL